MIAQCSSLFTELSSLQIALLAAGLLLQGAVFALVPEEAILLSLGALCAQGRIEYPLAFAAVLLGLLPANFIAVAIGRKLGSTILKRPAVGRAAGWLKRRGPVVVILTRFIPSVRGPIYLAVGASGFPLRRFATLDALASLIQVPLLLAIGSQLTVQLSKT